MKSFRLSVFKRLTSSNLPGTGGDVIPQPLPQHNTSLPQANHPITQDAVQVLEDHEVLLKSEDGRLPTLAKLLNINNSLSDLPEKNYIDQIFQAKLPLTYAEVAKQGDRMNAQKGSQLSVPFAQRGYYPLPILPLSNANIDMTKYQRIRQTKKGTSHGRGHGGR